MNRRQFFLNGGCTLGCAGAWAGNAAPSARRIPGFAELLRPRPQFWGFDSRDPVFETPDTA